MLESAGLLIIKNGKILLNHPTNAGWFETYSIPKGLVEEGEDKIDTAIRETYEEVGIKIPKEMIDTTEHVVEYIKNNKVFKTVTYYVVNLNNYTTEEFNIPDILDVKQLQIEEVDWAGFLTYKDAKDRIFWRFKPLLEYIK